MAKWKFPRARGRRAREEAERAYDAQRNLRPVESPPLELVGALRAVARAVPGVRWVTLAEYGGDAGGPVRLLVGVRMGSGAPTSFDTVEAAVVAAVAEAMPALRRPDVTELDADVDETTADGTANPYVVVRPA